jgi:hypothetical protein
MNICTLTRLSVFLGICAVANAEQKTNNVAEVHLPTDNISARVRNRDDLAGLYVQQFKTHASTIAFDLVGPSSELSWAERRWNDGYGIWADQGRTGRNLAQKSALAGLRETVVRLPAIEQRQDVVTEFIKGTVGNTDEERIDSLSPFATASESSWRQTLKKDNISYGVRPLDTRPYVYSSWAWRDKQGSTLLYDNLRLRYVAPDGMRLEDRLIIPFTDSWQLSFGAAADPRYFGGKDDDSTASISVSRVIDQQHIFSTGLNIDRAGRATFAVSFSINQ